MWSDTSQPDTLRLKAIDEMVWTYLLKTNPDSAVKCATLQYQLAQNIGNKNYAARSLLAMGRAKSQIDIILRQSIIIKIAYYLDEKLRHAIYCANTK